MQQDDPIIQLQYCIQSQWCYNGSTDILITQLVDLQSKYIKKRKPYRRSQILKELKNLPQLTPELKRDEIKKIYKKLKVQIQEKKEEQKEKKIEREKRQWGVSYTAINNKKNETKKETNLTAKEYKIRKLIGKGEVDPDYELLKKNSLLDDD